MNDRNHDQTCPANRTRAATLLATVSRDEATPEPVQLHCLAAIDALAEPAPWTERHALEPGDAQSRITLALRLLGQLPLDQFSQADVLAATRHARHALRELR